ncbi:hypothetical protein D934_10795 [Xylella fastidiosa subsp. sandyi Ann-1]|uniref:AB hydrolase-1 domain-containing protein n=2 Tax=Xylella fastidiosa TaxID=2371 RepID=A0A060HF23_XYLFS|nr:hypothetical protein D934_10795 [Xylella fastidiosa subsp. sandyi Ann-1]
MTSEYAEFPFRITFENNTMSYVKSFDGTSLWYEVHGHAGGTPVLLIAGNACDHAVWNYVLADFSAERQVIVFDHRGTGKSDDHFPESWSTRDFAKDASAVLQAAGVKHAHIYGHSMGGRVAQWLATDRPDVTLSLILGATSIGEKHGIPLTAATTKAMRDNDSVQLMAMCYPDDWVMAHPEEAMSGAPNPRSAEAFQAHIRASGEHDAWEIASLINAPTLVIHGSDDGITPSGNAGILAARIPGACLHMLEKARHVYWAGHPEVNIIISEFMKEAERLKP